MAHGENAAEKHNQRRELWGRRPFSGLGRGIWLKVMTHRAERRIAKRDIEEQLDDLRTQASNSGGGSDE